MYVVDLNAYLDTYFSKSKKKSKSTCFTTLLDYSIRIKIGYNRNLRPNKGACRFSERDTVDGSPDTTHAMPSKNEEWGATVRMGASAQVACFPLTTTWNPITQKCKRPRKSITFWHTDLQEEGQNRIYYDSNKSTHNHTHRHGAQDAVNDAVTDPVGDANVGCNEMIWYDAHTSASRSWARRLLLEDVWRLWEQPPAMWSWAPRAGGANARAGGRFPTGNTKHINEEKPQTHLLAVMDQWLRY